MPPGKDLAPPVASWEHLEHCRRGRAEDRSRADESVCAGNMGGFRGGGEGS